MLLPLLLNNMMSVSSGVTTTPLSPPIEVHQSIADGRGNEYKIKQALLKKEDEELLMLLKEFYQWEVL